MQTLSQHGSGRRKRKRRKGRREKGSRGHYGYPHCRRPIHHELPTRSTTGTCGSGDIRALHADDVNGGAWCGFAGAGDTSIVQDLDVDNVRIANLRTRAVMIMVIILVERIKLLRKCHLRRYIKEERESDESST